MSNNNILLLGAPGSGKGTQAQLLEKEYNLVKIDTGNLIRSNIKANTELGQQAKSFVEQGKLIPDELVINLIVTEAKSILSQGKNILLDGFPRNIAQAQALEENNIILNKVIEIDIDHSILVSRITGRRICTNKQCGAVYHTEFKKPTKENTCDICNSELYQRDDDTEKLVSSRLETYHTETAPLSEFYSNKNLLLKVNGTQDVQDVFAEIKTHF